MKNFDNMADSANAIAHSAGASVTSSTADDKNTGWKIFTGYRFLPYFAAEFSYVDLGQVSCCTTTIASGKPVNATFINETLKTRALTLDAVGILPFNQFDDVFGLLDIFGKIGSYYARTKLDINQGLLI